MIRTYSELTKLESFEDRFRYLQLGGMVGRETFGHERWMNQKFYQHDPRWKKVRDQVIIRDKGCDLGVAGFEIPYKIYIHHMNPIMANDFVIDSDLLLNPEYLICTSFNTHQAIHYGNESLLIGEPVERKPNDTCPWKIKEDETIG